MSELATTQRVRLNGTDREIPTGLSVYALLEHLELVPSTIVVEHNKSILRRESYPSVQVVEGDELELVHFVGGG